MRVLLVAYYFPPFNSVGAVRPGKWAKWLLERGHEVHILTCSNQPYPQGLPLEIPQSHVHAVPAWSVNAPVEWLRGGRARVAREGFGASSSSQGLLGRLGRFYKALAHWPDGQIGWVGAAVEAGVALAEKHAFEVIYASAPPFSGLRVASRIAQRARLPWVAELRDLWTDNHAYHAPAWRRALERRWEVRLLRDAAALVTVSAPLARQLARFGPPVWEVRNGCDPEDFDGLRPPVFWDDGPVGELNIAFTGNVYDPQYDVATFCAGVALDRQRGGQVRIHVAGRNDAALRRAAAVHGVESCFNFLKVIPRKEALALQRYADLLLFFTWGGGGDGVYSAKLFEYVNAGPLILTVGPPGDVAALVEEAGVGLPGRTAQEVADSIEAARKSRSPHGRQMPAVGGRAAFSRSAQFAALASRLEELLAHPRGVTS